MRGQMNDTNKEKIRIGIHQANFIPWLPYFHKMSKCDIFILLNHVQFEKSGFQNRYTLSNGKIITKAVESEHRFIQSKNYVEAEKNEVRPYHDQGSLVRINTMWIRAIAQTLNIKVFASNDDLFCACRPAKTAGLIDIIKSQAKCKNKDITDFIYVTNPNAKDKYLDEELMKSEGIEIEYCKTPKDMQIHIFEAFEKWGIDGTIKQLGR